MELRQLQIFLTAANTLNFTQTATILGYVQSNVTAQIKALEDEFGVPLFDRLGRQVTLTEAGQRLMIYAERMLSLAEETHHAVGANEIMEGTLTITAPESICTHRLPPLLRQFRDAFPQIRLIFQPMRFDDFGDVLRDGSVDIVFDLGVEFQSPMLCIETLITEPLMVVASPDNPLTALASVSSSDFDGQAILLTERGCRYRNIFERRLSQEGVYPYTDLEFESVEAIKQCAVAGLGIAVLPYMVVKKALENGELIALNISGLTSLNTQMMWHKDKWLSPATLAFIEMSRQYFAELAADVSYAY